MDRSGSRLGFWTVTPTKTVTNTEDDTAHHLAITHLEPALTLGEVPSEPLPPIVGQVQDFDHVPILEGSAIDQSGATVRALI